MKRTTNMNILNNTYIFIKILIVIVVLLLFSIPIFYFLKYLNKNKKTIKITPNFQIVSIENKVETDVQTSKEAIRLTKELLDKVK